MITTEPQAAPAEATRPWEQLYDRYVRPHMRPEDHGKFVAIDKRTGEYELDVDEIPAVLRLRQRLPEATVLLLRVGYPATYSI